MKIKCVVETGYANATHELEFDLGDFGYEDHEWGNLPEHQKQKIYNEACNFTISEYITASAWVEE